jgi:hypothetical protein
MQLRGCLQVKSPEDTGNFNKVDAGLAKLAELARNAKTAYAEGTFRDF